MRISVNIPIYNEQENIETLYNNLIAVLNSLDAEYEIIFINDGSGDDSSELIDSIANKNPNVKVIHLLKNYGQTYAMLAGFDYAKGDIIVTMDGDNQNDPKDIPLLLEKIDEGYSVVSGWRKNRKDAKFSKIIPSKIANWLISRITGIKLHDYGCSLKAYKKEVIKDLKLYGEMHRFIPIYSFWKGAKVAEIVVSHQPRRFGSSHYGISRVTKVLLDLILVKFLDKQFQRPIHLFGSFGLINFFLAFLSFFLMLYYKYLGGKSFIETPLPTLTILFLLVGVISILLGIVAEIVMRTYYESQNKKPYLVERIVN
jgi:glycosyltransferase involved in cell wall biosynthesis